MSSSPRVTVLRRTMSASLAQGNTMQLNKRVELAREMLTRFKETGEIIEESDLERVIRILVEGEYRPDFLETLDAGVDDTSSEPEAVTLRWLASTYSGRGRRDSTISVRSRIDLDESDLHALVSSPVPGENASRWYLPTPEQEGEPGDKYPISLPPPQEAALAELFAHYDTWNFDVFALNSASANRPLLFSAWHALRHHKCMETFGIDPRKMRALLHAIEAGYVSSNPYHNATHAADVVQTVHYFLVKSAETTPDLFTPLQKFGLIMAAAGHDVGHNGVNNAFHINTSSPLALRYNDVSVLENHHVSTLFCLATSDEKLNAFESLEHDTYVSFRKLVIGLILGTDMSNHSSTVSGLHLKVDVKGADPMAWDERDHLLEALLHAADISNPVKPTTMAVEWADRCLNEFWNQGDKEKSLSLTVSPMCDRNSTSRPQSQIGFINFVVKPYFLLLSKIVPALSICVEHADKNLAHWEAMKVAAQ